MSEILLLDSSVYLNVLDIPGFNQDRSTIIEGFVEHISRNDHFLLPLASVWETGNHIARLSDGGTRRFYAQVLVNDVSRAFNGDVPYRATHFPEREEFREWLMAFPEMAMCNKSEKKIREGISLADLSIIKEWKRTCERHRLSRVRIWSLDSDLAGYDREP